MAGDWGVEGRAGAPAQLLDRLERIEPIDVRGRIVEIDDAVVRRVVEDEARVLVLVDLVVDEAVEQQARRGRADLGEDAAAATGGRTAGHLGEVHLGDQQIGLAAGAEAVAGESVSCSPAGATARADCPADLNSDGVVDIPDLLIVLATRA